MKFIYNVLFVRGPLNSAKLTLSQPSKCSSLFLLLMLTPVQEGELLSSAAQAFLLSFLQTPLEPCFPTAVVLQMDPAVFLRHLMLLSGSLEWDWFWEEQLGAGAGEECCLSGQKWFGARGSGMFQWAGAQPVQELQAGVVLQLLSLWEVPCCHPGAEGQQVHLCASVTADRWQPRCAEAGGAEPGAPWRKLRQSGCPTARAPCWRAGCATLSGLALSKQLAGLAAGKESLSHSHQGNGSQERATWQQLPGICDFGNLSMVGSEKEVWMNYSVSTRFFLLGDPGTIFLLLSLPCWFLKSAACRNGP